MITSITIYEALKVEFSAARISEFKAFVQDGRSYEKLVQAFAPSIWYLSLSLQNFIIYYLFIMIFKFFGSFVLVCRAWHLCFIFLLLFYYFWWNFILLDILFTWSFFCFLWLSCFVVNCSFDLQLLMLFHFSTRTHTHTHTHTHTNTLP